MSHVEQPAPVGLPPLAHGRDGLVHRGVRSHAGRAQVVERT